MKVAPTPDEYGAESLVARVTDSFMDQLRRGDRPDIDEYARRHPEIASVLRNVLPDLEAMGSSSPDYAAGELALPVGPRMGGTAG
jgi:hypothetical protein